MNKTIYFKVSKLGLGTKFIHNWIKEGLIDHIFPNGIKTDIELSEAFEVKLYLELHTIGCNTESLKRVSNILHKYALPADTESLQIKKVHPIDINEIIEMVTQGRKCFLTFDYSGNMRLLTDDVFYMTFMKDNYFTKSAVHMVISANRILKELGYSPKWSNKDFIHKILQKELKLRNQGKATELVVINPKTSIHSLLKEKNRTILVGTNNEGKINLIQEMKTFLIKDKKA